MDWLTRQIVGQAAELFDQVVILEQIIEAVDTAVAWVDRDLVYQRANGAYCRMINRTRDEIIGQEMFSVFPGTDSGGIVAMFEQVMRTGRPFTARRFPFSYPDRGLEKSAFWDGTASPVFDKRGGIAGILIVCRNVTDQVLFEDEKRRREAAFESSISAIISLSKDGLVTGWNRSAERIFGYTAREILHRPVTLLFPKDRQAELQKDLETLLHGNPVSHFSERLRKTGDRFPVYANKIPVKGASGEVVGVFASTADLTEDRHQLARR